MQVKQVMTTKPEYLDADATIGEAALRMQREERGFVPVAEREQLIGVVTDRDIALRALAQGKNADDKINSIMSGKVLYCYEGDDIKDVLQNMQQQNVQRLIVLNNKKNKDFMGVITLSDIADKCDEKDTDMLRRVAHCCRHYH